MSISSELAKLLKQAGVDPNLYDTERPGFRRDYKLPEKPADTGNKELDGSKKEKKPTSLDIGPLQNEGSFEDILKKLNVDPNLYRDDHWSKKLPKSADTEEIPRKRNRDRDTSAPEKKKPAALKIGPLQEFNDPKSRSHTIAKEHEDKALKLVYQWTKEGSIDFTEFEDLLAEIVRKIRPRL